MKDTKTENVHYGRKPGLRTARNVRNHSRAGTHTEQHYHSNGRKPGQSGLCKVLKAESLACYALSRFERTAKSTRFSSQKATSSENTQREEWGELYPPAPGTCSRALHMFLPRQRRRTVLRAYMARRGGRVASREGISPTETPTAASFSSECWVSAASTSSTLQRTSLRPKVSL